MTRDDDPVRAAMVARYGFDPGDDAVAAVTDALDHDAAFAAHQARRDAARAATVTVTWRRVSKITGGGVTGHATNGDRDVFVRPGARGFDYGDVDYGRVRVIRGTAPTLAAAKAAAAKLVRHLSDPSAGASPAHSPGAPTERPSGPSTPNTKETTPMSDVTDFVKPLSGKVLHAVAGEDGDPAIAAITLCGRTVKAEKFERGVDRRATVVAGLKVCATCTAKLAEQSATAAGDPAPDTTDPKEATVPTNTDRKQAEQAAAPADKAAPAEQAAPTTSGTDLAKALLREVKSRVRGTTVVDKPSYQQLKVPDLSRVAAYLHVGKKGLTVEVPRADGATGYERVKVAGPDAVASVADTIADRVRAVKAAPARTRGGNTATVAAAPEAAAEAQAAPDGGTPDAA